MTPSTLSSRENVWRARLAQSEYKIEGRLRERGGEVTLSDHQVGEDESGRVTREDVVAAQHMSAVDGETSTRHDGHHSLHNDEPREVLHPGPALVPHVGLGEDRDAHGDGPVVVEDAQHQPDSPEYDQSVGVAGHHAQGQQQVHHQQDLTDVQPELLVGDVVQDQVGEGGGVGGDPVVGEGQAEGGGQEPGEQEDSTQQCFKWLLW